MVELTYKVGDVLEIPANIILPRAFGVLDKEETCRCLVLDVVLPGYGVVTYTFLVHKDGFRTYNVVGVNQKSIADCAVLIGNIDISLINYKASEEDNLRFERQMLIKQRDELRKHKKALLDAVMERDRTIKRISTIISRHSRKMFLKQRIGPAIKRVEDSDHGTKQFYY